MYQIVVNGLGEVAAIMDHNAMQAEGKRHMARTKKDHDRIDTEVRVWKDAARQVRALNLQPANP